MAAPVYLARQALAALADPPSFDAIVPSYVDINALAAKMPRSQRRFNLNPVIWSDDTTLTHHMVRAGMGAAFLPEWLVAEDLAAGCLARVLQGDAQGPVNTLFAVYTSRQYMAPKLRTFIDFLGQALGGDPALEKPR